MFCPNKNDNKRLLLFLVLLVLSGFTSNALATQLFPPLHFSFSPVPNTKVKVKLENNAITAQIFSPLNKKNIIQTLIPDISSLPNYAQDIWTEDFNFDGSDDIAIATDVDKTGLDLQYQIFKWDAATQTFKPLVFSDALSNIETLKDRRELRSSFKSGNFWTEVTFRFIDGQPYRYVKSDLIAIDVWHTTVFDLVGHPIKSLISKDGRIEGPPRPVTFPIASEQAWLFNQPAPSARSNLSLHRGNIVTLLDFKLGSGNLQWVLVRFNGKNTLEKWIQISDLDLG
jgi:hypothetical protein